MKNMCECGNEKDTRSAKCRACFLASGGRPTKVCTSCKEEKIISEFRFRPRAGEDRPRAECRLCEAARYRTHRAANPEKIKETKKKWEGRNPDKTERIALRKSAKAYGLDPNEVERHFDAHHGKCDICGGDPVGRSKRLSIDHCHTTNKFRGLLCGTCNTGLGQFKDDPDLLLKAIGYLKSSIVAQE